MTISFGRFSLPVLALFCLIISGCNDSTETERLSLGDGTVHTFFVSGDKNIPEVIGIEMTASAFKNLPTATSDGRWDIVDMDGNIASHCCGHELTLPLAEGIENSPFKHIVVNWNPHGHAPDGIFHLPHFDFHFYTISEQERHSIAAPKAEQRCMVPGPDGVLQPVPLDCEHYAKAIKPLPAEHMPTGYISVGAVEPAMGDHLLDPTSPALNGVMFTHTWIWGAWNGGIAFMEPMVTLAYLESLRDDDIIKHCKGFAMPEKVAEANWYPTTYCMEYVEKSDVFTITLTDWEWFDS